MKGPTPVSPFLPHAGQVTGRRIMQNKVLANEHLLRAAEHEARASASQDQNLKAIHRELAEQYRRLAEQAEHGPYD